MKRDYSLEMLEELKETIREIDDEQWCGFTDALGDMGNTFSSWIGWLDADNYVDNIGKYHKKVLDQHDTTEAQLEKIFEDVRIFDSNSAPNMMTSNSAVSNYNQLLQQMVDLITPGNGNFTAKEIKSSTKQLVKSVTDASKSLDAVYEDMLSERAKQVAADAGWGLIGDALGFLCDMGGFVANVATGDFIGAAADGWGMINNMFAFASDLSALGAMGLGWTWSAITGDNYAMSYCLEEAEKLQDNDGLADVIRDEGWDGVADVVSGIDTLAGGYQLFEGVKGFGKGVKEAHTILHSDVLSDGWKLGYVKDLLIKNTGFSFTDYGDPLKNQESIFKNINNVYKWVTGAKDGKLGETAISNWGGVGLVGKGKSVLEDLFDTLVDTVS